MKVYIATNKDNKDALMHYGVKGMRWGKRGGRRAGEETIPENTIPENIIEEQYIYEDYASNSPKNHHRRPGKGHKTISRKNNISTGARPQQNKIYAQDRTKAIIKNLLGRDIGASNKSGVYDVGHRFTDMNRVRNALKSDAKDFEYDRSHNTSRNRNMDQFRKAEKAKKDAYRSTKDRRREQEQRRHGRR